MSEATNRPSNSIRERFAIVFSHIRKYRTYLILGGISVALSAVFNVVRPYLIKLLLDDLEAGTLKYYGLDLAGAFVGLTALSGLFLFFNRRTVIWMSRKLEYDIRGELFGKLLRLPLSFYHENRVGDLMARLTNDIEAIRLVFGPAIMYFTNTIFSTILALTIM
ncbi:MAG TPA: ABC transporter transmembrane domain-containing protein, partial [candidate division Zixibacteria bacterium]|nr:ABC transporter transmembrane domain-containing protein [candidate division Zixibacteria bacterium]